LRLLVLEYILKEDLEGYDDYGERDAKDLDEVRSSIAIELDLEPETLLRGFCHLLLSCFFYAF